MTTLRREAHKICLVARDYPSTTFWLVACATFAAGSERNLYFLVPLLLGQLIVVHHVVRRMWSPPIVISIPPETGRVVIPIQPRAPGIERHRHVRR